MKENGELTAQGLRERFRAIPKDIRDANQSFGIRIWRGLSWLERAEQATDADEQFIALWIAFNAIYGRVESEAGRNGDRGTWQAFIADVAKLDTSDRLGDLVQRNKTSILRLINNKYLFRPFWGKQADAALRLRKASTLAVVHLSNHLTTGVLQELFERLYVLRQQVFHGAATRGSKLNRPTLRLGAEVMLRLLPGIIATMLDAGPSVNWGEVCFPPVAE